MGRNKSKKVHRGQRFIAPGKITGKLWIGTVMYSTRLPRNDRLLHIHYDGTDKDDWLHFGMVQKSKCSFVLKPTPRWEFYPK